jgi:hypothetical protein
MTPHSNFHHLHTPISPPLLNRANYTQSYLASFSKSWLHVVICEWPHIVTMLANWTGPSHPNWLHVVLMLETITGGSTDSGIIVTYLSNLRCQYERGVTSSSRSALPVLTVNSHKIVYKYHAQSCTRRGPWFNVVMVHVDNTEATTTWSTPAWLEVVLSSRNLTVVIEDVLEQMNTGKWRLLMTNIRQLPR